MSTNKIARFRKAVLGGAAAAAVALPLALTAGPAQAATLNGCTVTPLQPVRIGTLGGVPLLRFDTRVTCLGNHIVQIVDQRYEADAPAGILGDDFLGSTVHLRTFAVNGSVIVSARDLVPNSELGFEEVYHRTAFRVATIGGVTGFTSFQDSPLRLVAI